MSQEMGQGQAFLTDVLQTLYADAPPLEVGLQPLTLSDRLLQGQSVRGDTRNFVLDTPGRHHLNQGLGVKTTCLWIRHVPPDML